MVPGGITCANVRCGANSECVGCAQNNCNTYTCEKPNGGVCTRICNNPGAHCICIKGHHRDEATGQCVPLKCPGGPMKPAVEPKPVPTNA